MKWESLRKGINGLVNKVNVANIKEIVPELFRLNLVRGRGLFCRALMKAQMTSPGFTHIYVALVAVVNTKMPENGELLLKRVIYQFRRAFGRNNKIAAIALAKFIAHMVNQQVAHELLALQVLFLLLEKPTEDSVEVAVGFTKEIGQILSELSPAGLEEVMKRFRGILHEGTIDKRVQYTIENLFAIRRNGFKDYPAVHEQLDLIEASDQITHDTSLDDESIEIEDHLDVFNEDPEFLDNEKLWAEIRREVLDDSDDSGSEGGDESESGSSSDDDDDNDSSSSDDDNGHVQEDVKRTTEIQDATETDLVNLRRTIYLTIMSSLDFEECAHKLLKINMKEGQESELAMMLLECCSQERTYLRYYGLLGQRFCNLKREYCDAFDDQFVSQFQSIHKYETNKLRNVAKFFAHLLYTDALPWTCMEIIHLNEEETTSSSRIFIKILFQELAEYMGLKKLRERLNDPFMQEIFLGLFPRDNPRNTRFSINFFTSIGLGGLTDALRSYLKNMPKNIMSKRRADDEDKSSSGDSSSSSSDSSSSSSGSDSDSGSSSSSSGSGSSRCRKSSHTCRIIILFMISITARPTTGNLSACALPPSSLELIRVDWHDDTR